jgi:hypothetical protein
MQLDRVLYEKVCKFLWEEWDPIGVNTTECPNDEYDSYAAGLIRLVHNGGDAAAVAKRLEQIETEDMELGMAQDNEQHMQVAEKLIRLMRG